MDELKQILGNVIDQLPDLIDQLSPEEFASVKEVIDTATRRIKRDTIDETDRIPRGAEFLYLLAGGDPVAFANYARQFPDPELNRLAQNKPYLTSVLDRLGKQVSITKGSEQGVPQADLQSSTVYGFNYDNRNKKLYVKFQGDGVYEYDNVPYTVFKMFANGRATAKTDGRNKYGVWFRGKNPSLGAAMNQLIKQAGFPYRKVA